MNLMSEVPAVAFAFTRPDAVVYIGKAWKDAQDRRYRIHIYPSRRDGGSLSLAKDRPNIVILRRADKASELHTYAKDLHRIIFLGGVDELLPLGVPILDAVEDEEGNLRSAPPRANVEFYNRKIEDEASPYDLSPPRQKTTKTKKKKKGKKPLPKTLTAFLDEIEPYLDDGSVWQDLEEPVLSFFVGRTSAQEFQDHCKNLAKKGVKKSLSKAYFRWVVVKEAGLMLASTFDIVARNLEEGVSVNIRALAKKSGVNPEDLSNLYTLYRAELEEEKE